MPEKSQQKVWLSFTLFKPDSTTTFAAPFRRHLPAFISSGTLCLSLAWLHPPENLCQFGCTKRPRVWLETTSTQPGLWQVRSASRVYVWKEACSCLYNPVLILRLLLSTVELSWEKMLHVEIHCVRLDIWDYAVERAKTMRQITENCCYILTIYIFI